MSRSYRAAAPRRGAVVVRVVVAAVLGALTAAVGTILHLQTQQLLGVSLPWGAVSALMLMFCAALWTGLWLRSGWFSVLCGAGSYATAGLLAIPRGGYGLIINNLQGNLWLYGIAVVTPAAAWLCAAVLRHGGIRK